MGILFEQLVPAPVHFLPLYPQDTDLLTLPLIESPLMDLLCDVQTQLLLPSQIAGNPPVELLLHLGPLTQLLPHFTSLQGQGT